MFVLLAILAIALRFIPIAGNNFSFMYDSAKDSLVMLEMAQQFKPALVGPTTSIDGLFYGPAWYYIALPFNILGRFHPISSVVAVSFLMLLNLWLFYKYVGKFSAFVYALSVGTIGSQQTAWTPYMTSFIILPIMLLLSKLKPGKYPNAWVLGSIMFLTSLLFHFEVAFGMVFLPVVIVMLFIMKAKINLRLAVIALLAFGVTLLPSALFELRHQFIQTRSVLHFIQNYGEQSSMISPNTTGPARIFEVARYMYDSAHLSILPMGNMTLSVLAILLIIMYVVKKAPSAEKKITLFMLFGIFLLFLEMPIKPYYLAAITPIWVFLFSRAVTVMIPKRLLHVVVLFLVIGMFNMVSARSTYQRIAKSDSFLLAPKLQAIQAAYAMSEGKQFNSYQYVPEIYDYTYQLIYLREGVLGKHMPSEFSYAPGEITYIPQKHVNSSAENDPKNAAYTMLIVERYKNKKLFDAWWDRVAKNLEVVETKQINDAITVYKTVAND